MIYSEKFAWYPNAEIPFENQKNFGIQFRTE